MNKEQLLAQIIAQLQSEMDMLTQAALDTHAEATDEENKAEDKYDTRGLEASYLAIGQSKAAEEAALAHAQFSAMVPRTWNATDPISLGALLTLEGPGGGRAYYFMGPRAGGTEIKHAGKTVMVITPQSPLGHQLLGHLQGDSFQLQLGSKRSLHRLTSVV